MSATAKAVDVGDLMQASADVARAAAADKQVRTVMFLLATNTEPTGSFGRIVKYIRAVARAKAQGTDLVPATVERQIGVLTSAHRSCNLIGATALEHCYQIGRLVHLAESLGALREVGVQIIASARNAYDFFAYRPFHMGPLSDASMHRLLAGDTLLTLATLPIHPHAGKALDLFTRVARQLAPDLTDEHRAVFLAELVQRLGSVYGSGSSGLHRGSLEAAGVLAVHAAIVKWVCDDPLRLFRHSFQGAFLVYNVPARHEIVVPFLDALFRSQDVYDAQVREDWRNAMPDAHRPLFDQYVAMHLPDSKAAVAANDLPGAQKVIVRAFAEANLELAERRLPPEIVGKVFAHLYHDETPTTTKEGAATSTTPFAQLLTREARNAVFGADLERQAHDDVIGAFRVTDEQQTRALQQPRQVSRWERVVRAREPDDDDESVYGYADDAGTNDNGNADGDADMDGLEQQAANLRVSAPPPTKRGRVAGRAAAAALAQQQFDW